MNSCLRNCPPTTPAVRANCLCAGGFSWIGYLNSDRYGRLVPCVQRPFRSLHFGDGLWAVVPATALPCYAGTRGDGLDVTHSVSVARAGCQTVGSGHPRTPCDPPRHAPLSPCSALHRSLPPLYAVAPPRRCVPYTTASALHFALPPLHICSLQPPLKPARFSI